MIELSLAVTELKRCGEALFGISESLTDLFSTHDDTDSADQPNAEALMQEDKPITFETGVYSYIAGF
ncbi:hypothetical protein [Paenibacillus validus]|uniref:Uncharacterized protein n=1 Tax=Paenibacillus validus TaxID=44253 RepID=A0A7X2Z919_9BACL|nr:hypothetical protein [Paenibacillus validus]MUG70590.1 hypothetical protein [Paenibacillus validus]